MYKRQDRQGKFNLVCECPSKRAMFYAVRPSTIRAVLLTLVAAWLTNSQAEAGVFTLPMSYRMATTSNATAVCGSREQIGQSLSRASELMQQSRFTEAAGLLEPLADKRCDPRANLLLAAADEGSGDIRASESTLERAHSAWPTDNSVAASLARTYFAERKTDDAAEALAQFRANPSTPLQEMELASVVLLAAHRLTAAQRIAEQEYSAYPSVKSLLLLANTFQLQGKYKDVIAKLTPLRPMYAGSAPFLITLSESEYDALLFDTARTDLTRAIALDPTSYQGHFLLGNVLVKLGSQDQAIDEYRRALQLAPQQPRTYYQLALALEAKGDGSEAEQLLQQGIDIDEHYALAHLELGRLLLGRHQTADAVGQLKLALADNPQLEQAYFLLAKAYAQMGEAQKSDAMAKKLVEVRTANHQSLQKGSDGIQPSH